MTANPLMQHLSSEESTKAATTNQTASRLTSGTIYSLRKVFLYHFVVTFYVHGIIYMGDMNSASGKALSSSIKKAASNKSQNNDGVKVEVKVEGMFYEY